MTEPPTDHDDHDDADQQVSRRALSVLVASFAAGCLGTRRERAVERRTEPVRTATATTASSETPASTPTPPVDSPNVADVLVGLIRADDRAAYAADNRLDYTAGRVRVVVERAPGGEFPTDVPYDVVARSTDAIEVYVDPDDIPQIAASEDVTAVRPPSRAVPQSK